MIWSFKSFQRFNRFAQFKSFKNKRGTSIFGNSGRSTEGVVEGSYGIFDASVSTSE